MAKIDRLLEAAATLRLNNAYQDYDYSRLTTEELRELISGNVTSERIVEILEPVKFVSRDTDSIRRSGRR